MKKIYLLVIVVFLSCAAIAQTTELHQNFDSSCGTSGLNYPPKWLEYNVIPDVDSLAWHCVPVNGRYSTPGMRCQGYYSGSYHLDTAWLFTPAIHLEGYPDSIYLRFDSKYEVGVQKSGLSVHCFRYRTDTTNPTDTILNISNNVTSALSPVIGNADSFGWVTHQISLSPYKSNDSVIVAFRYVSTTTMAGAWTIDNVFTSPFSMGVESLQRKNNAILLTANSQYNQLDISFTTPQTGSYFLALYDITGKEVLKQNIDAAGGKESIILQDAHNPKGLYFLKMWNEQSMGIAKVVVY